MNTFVLSLSDATCQQRFADVISFIGTDASGSFGIKANHARFMTSLNFGLARFCINPDNWQYLALPGGILYFFDNELSITTRHYLIDRDLERITQLLELQLSAEEEVLRATRESVHRMDQAMLRCMVSLQRKTGRQ